ncbi:MAG: exodeoxyribonuclease VII large subunit [Planctomycetota bacterium]
MAREFWGRSRYALGTMEQPPVISVSQLSDILQGVLESAFPCVWVSGEISNCTRAASGHYYLTLKDETAQIRAVIWRGTAQRLKFQVQDGLQVIAVGPIELYAARGTYQLTIEQLIPQGLGPLELAFRQLHDKLEAEGLFDPERKRPLPRFPRTIALVTSPTSAAVRDMLQVITRRWQQSNIVIVPVPVQGEGAAEQIAAALRTVHLIPEVDIVITGRGGGSLEDLWAFNEEVVARAIFDCRIPVISAVGHEIDVSISDLVADRRALTPSEAAELVVPHRDEVRAELDGLRGRLTQALQGKASRARWQLESLANRRAFTHPRERLQDQTRRLDDLAERAVRAWRQRVVSARQQVQALAGHIDALSPLQILERGFTLTFREGQRTPLKQAAELQVGDRVDTFLQQGRITSEVLSIQPEQSLISPVEPEVSVPF